MKAESAAATLRHLETHHEPQFRSPWHVCIHGLGLGDLSVAGTPEDREQLLQLSNALRERQAGDYSRFAHHVLSIALAGTPVDDSQRSIAVRCHVDRALALAESFENAQQLVAAVALLVEVLVGTARAGEFRTGIERCLALALSRLHTFALRNDSDRYAALSASFVLFNAIRVTGLTDCLLTASQSGSPHLTWAVRALSMMEDRFYKARAAAILFAIVASSGLSREAIATCSLPLEAALLAARTIPSTKMPQRPSDGIHVGNDFLAFEVSLLLAASALLNEPEAAAESETLAAVADQLISTLPPPSLASQFAFYADAMLAVSLRSADELRFQFARCLDKYLLTPVRGDSYLRCAYLAYAAMRLGLGPALPDALFDRINLASISHRSVASGYFGLPMVAAYTIYTRSLDPSYRSRLVGPADLADRINSGPYKPYRFEEEKKLCYAMVHGALVIPKSYASMRLVLRS